MTRQRSFLSGLAVALGLLTAPAAHAFTLSYEQTVTTGREETQSRVIVKDWMFRIERTLHGKPMVTVRNPKGIFSFYPEKKIGAKITSMDATQQRFLDHVANYPQYLQRQQARLIAEEDAGIYPCQVYLVEDRAMGGNLKVWLWTEEHVPVKLLMISPRGKVTVQLSNIQVGIRAADTLFELPVGIELTDPDTFRSLSTGSDDSAPAAEATDG